MNSDKILKYALIIYFLCWGVGGAVMAGVDYIADKDDVRLLLVLLNALPGAIVGCLVGGFVGLILFVIASWIRGYALMTLAAIGSLIELVGFLYKHRKYTCIIGAIIFLLFIIKV